MKKTFIILSILIFSSCASKENPDPLEPVNRQVYYFNDIVDGSLLKPISYMYQDLMPTWGKKRINNALTNLSEPVTFVNSTIQLDGEHSFTTFWRFVINSTFGVAGTFDVASNMGLKHRREDFGQTLGHYNIGPGAYIVLPFLGPSSARDTTGRIVDWAADPFNYVEDDIFQASAAAVNVVTKREGMLEFTEEIEKFSFDPYVAIRSSYFQNRQKQIENR